MVRPTHQVFSPKMGWRNEQCEVVPVRKCFSGGDGGGGDAQLLGAARRTGISLSQVSWLRAVSAPWFLNCEGVARRPSLSLRCGWSLFLATWQPGWAFWPSWRFRALLIFFHKVFSWLNKPEQSSLLAIKNPEHDSACALSYSFKDAFDEYLRVAIGTKRVTVS